MTSAMRKWKLFGWRSEEPRVEEIRRPFEDAFEELKRGLNEQRTYQVPGPLILGPQHGFYYGEFLDEDEMDEKAMKTLMSSKKMDWGTPRAIVEAAEKRWAPGHHGEHLCLDVCATDENAKCHGWINPNMNGLTASWHYPYDYGTGCPDGKATVCWMNPPYGDEIVEWVKKANQEALENGVKTVALLPARTDTKWFQDYCLQWPVVFVRGRIKFEGAENPAPFPSVFVLFGFEDHERGEATFIVPKGEKPKGLVLEVGKRYRTRGGGVVELYGRFNDGQNVWGKLGLDFPFQGKGIEGAYSHTYTVDGKHEASGIESQDDLVEEVA